MEGYTKPLVPPLCPLRNTGWGHGFQAPDALEKTLYQGVGSNQNHWSQYGMQKKGQRHTPLMWTKTNPYQVGSVQSWALQIQGTLVGPENVLDTAVVEVAWECCIVFTAASLGPIHNKPVPNRGQAMRCNQHGWGWKIIPIPCDSSAGEVAGGSSAWANCFHNLWGQSGLLRIRGFFSSLALASTYGIRPKGWKA